MRATASWLFLAQITSTLLIDGLIWLEGYFGVGNGVGGPERVLLLL
jgi:hypothetical protein